MISLPDFREKQILFINGSDLKENNLSFKNENVCLRRDGEVINQLSCHKILALFITGTCTISSPLIRKCIEYGVSIFLLGDNLKCYAEIPSEAAGNFILRGKQYALTSDQELTMAKLIVANKIKNQHFLLKERSQIGDDWLAEKLAKVMSVNSGESLLGLEGVASKEFYQAYFRDIKWYRRMPRTKVDINNTLLDIGYTFLFHVTGALLSLHGLDTYKGFYHKLFFQRKSLACDLMEPMRCIIERQLVKSYNLKQIDEKDFFEEKGEWKIMYEHQKKYTTIFAQAIMDRKEEVFKYIHSFYFYIFNEMDLPSDQKRPFPTFSL